MVKSFKSLKPSALGELDVIPFGKLKGCRIIDVLNEDYEYLIWLEKNTGILYNKDLIAKLKNKFLENERKVYVKNEIEPWLEKEYDNETMAELGLTLEDIPF